LGVGPVPEYHESSDVCFCTDQKRLFYIGGFGIGFNKSVRWPPMSLS
jgi:hypothetical protein